MLGEELKRRREELGLSLAQISESTRIGTRFLRAIETNDFSTLPEGIYTRSFIRAYAKQVHMNEDEALDLYQEQTGTTGPLEDPSVVHEEDDSSFVYKEPSNSFLPAAVVAIALALVLITGSWALWRYINKPATSEAADVPAEPAPAAVAPEPDQSTQTQPASFEEGMQVTIEATTDRCWIRYTADNGEPTQMTLEQGQQEQIKANDSVELSIGNTKAIAIRINGREVYLPEGTGIVLPKLTITPETAKQLVEPPAATVQ